MYTQCHNTRIRGASHLFAARLPFPIVGPLLDFLEEDLPSVVMRFVGLSTEQGIMSSLV